jgi:nucleoside-diphosphate-sugar epimerase
MSTKVLVVGAAGYIGGGVARAFRRAGYLVYGLIRHESARDQLLREEIIPILGSINKPEGFKSAIEDCSIIIDGIYLPGHSHALFDYVRKLRGTNITSNQIQYMLTSGIMIYYPGYFRETLRPVDESIIPNPTDEFEMIPKRELEKQILAATDIRGTVIRPGFVYGGHGGVIAPLFFNVDLDKDIIIEGRPDKRWSWVHVDDLGDGYVAVAKAGSVVDRQIFNLSAQDSPTYEELKVTAARAAGWKGSRENIKYVPLPESEFRRKNWETNVIINPKKAYDLLGWRPSHVGVLNEIEIYYESWKASRSLKTE